MRFSKVFKDELDHGYAILRMNELGRDFVLIASEENRPCYAYDLDDNYRRITVWPDVGGTMTMVQLPGTLDFLATQRFYPGFNSKTCRIVHAHFNGTDWDVKPIADTPYIHRFDVIKHDGGYWYVGCSIANSKKFTDDWSDPGKVFVGSYDPVADCLKDVRELGVRITKNHGYRRETPTTSLITGHEGIFRLHYPQNGEDWRIERLADDETSDIAMIDIDGDGHEEYLAIQGFHGDHLRLYDDQFNTLDSTEGGSPFGHAIDSEMLFGKPYFLFGYRGGDQELMTITAPDRKMHKTIIESGVGPSNVTVFRKDGEDYLLSANRESNSLAIYHITDEVK
ncbi:hypothetical protein OZX73_03575 [Bifidobacterium sp. ESL0775]|uniref:hypothetical protein n=1 Tax=Bifidobacterium sp. ESL0775 TaxID=2983230 RepID=UPI0023FA0DCB|nr:hypothetical protein [Bifidobacterium sp. ESL0775]WEV69951.1 hypothetical protein OZX73_03575 [Bifidobacterium sp. ESL0775]